MSMKPEDNDEAVEIDLESGKEVEATGAAQDGAGDGFSDAVEVVDDTPAQDRGRERAPAPTEVTEEELAKHSIEVQRRLKHLSRGYHDERREKEQALREREAAVEHARRVQEELRQAREQLANGSTEYIATAKEAAEARLQSAQRAFKDAYDAGDAEAMAKAQAEITSAQLRISRAAELKPIQIPETVVQTQPQPRVDAKTQAWMGRNTWFGPNKRLTAFAMGLHQELAESGVAPGSDAYFNAIDQEMKERFPEVVGGTPTRQTATPNRSTAAVAPAARSTPSNRITLTKSEANIANALGVPLAEYAKQKAAREKEARNG
jgi:hypothetical protein